MPRLGDALVCLGRPAEAAQAYRDGLDIRRKLDPSHLATEPLAGLARVALAQDDRGGALVYVKEILSHLETGGVDGTDEPLRIYLICYRVLHVNDDVRAGEGLQTAHGLLQERAAKIDDEDLRRSFLKPVARPCFDFPANLSILGMGRTNSCPANHDGCNGTLWPAPAKIGAYRL